FHPPRSSPSAGPDPAAPLHVSTYAATSRLSHNSPTPRHAATLARWLRSSDLSHTTSRGTTSPRLPRVLENCACLAEVCRRHAQHRNKVARTMTAFDP